MECWDYGGFRDADEIKILRWGFGFEVGFRDWGGIK